MFAPLARLSKYGTICYHSAFVSISSIAPVQALPVDPKYWRRLRTRRKKRLVM